jgi:hypothetical protein
MLKTLLVRVNLILLILIWTESSSFAQSHCADFGLNLLKNNHPQEEVLLAFRDGLQELGNSLEQSIEHELLSSSDFTLVRRFDEGFSQPYLLKTESGLLAVWKPHPTSWNQAEYDIERYVRALILYNAQNERTIYEISRFFRGLIYVPVTIVRSIKGITGSLQAYVEPKPLESPDIYILHRKRVGKLFNALFNLTDRYDAFKNTIAYEDIPVFIDNGAALNEKSAQLWISELQKIISNYRNNDETALIPKELYQILVDGFTESRIRELLSTRYSEKTIQILLQAREILISFLRTLPQNQP